VTDRDAICNLLGRFCQYLDERRFDEWAQLFAPDASFGHQTGRTAIAAAITTSALARQPELFRKHTTANPVITVAAGTAVARSDLVLFERSSDDPWVLRTGVYDDRLVKLDSAWYFAARQLTWTANGLRH
jgi:hypothetical protein